MRLPAVQVTNKTIQSCVLRHKYCVMRIVSGNGAIRAVQEC